MPKYDSCILMNQSIIKWKKFGDLFNVKNLGLDLESSSKLIFKV